MLPAGVRVDAHASSACAQPLPLAAQHFLCGLFNSFVVNYLVRLRVTTHVTTATVERLPIPARRITARVCWTRIAALARLLSRRGRPVAFARLQAPASRASTS